MNALGPVRGGTRQAVACKRGEVVFSSFIACASDYLAGCQIIDMSDPGDPVWVGSLLNPIVEDMQVHGDWIYFGSYAAPRHVTAAASSAPLPRSANASLAATVHPNPFNPAAIVNFELEARGPVRVTVHDLAGRRLATVADAVFEPGRHAVRWDGEVDGGKAASGTCFFSVTAGNTRQSVEAVRLKGSWARRRTFLTSSRDLRRRKSPRATDRDLFGDVADT